MQGGVIGHLRVGEVETEDEIGREDATTPEKGAVKRDLVVKTERESPGIGAESKEKTVHEAEAGERETGLVVKLGVRAIPNVIAPAAETEAEKEGQEAEVEVEKNNTVDHAVGPRVVERKEEMNPIVPGVRARIKKKEEDTIPAGVQVRTTAKIGKDGEVEAGVDIKGGAGGTVPPVRAALIHLETGRVKMEITKVDEDR